AALRLALHAQKGHRALLRLHCVHVAPPTVVAVRNSPRLPFANSGPVQRAAAKTSQSRGPRARTTANAFDARPQRPDHVVDRQALLVSRLRPHRPERRARPAAQGDRRGDDSRRQVAEEQQYRGGRAHQEGRGPQRRDQSEEGAHRRDQGGGAKSVARADAAGDAARARARRAAGVAVAAARRPGPGRPARAHAAVEPGPREGAQDV
ncbi:unnamed protein product, partial [Pelagomonas calceolata]